MNIAFVKEHNVFIYETAVIEVTIMCFFWKFVIVMLW